MGCRRRDHNRHRGRDHDRHRGRDRDYRTDSGAGTTIDTGAVTASNSHAADNPRESCHEAIMTQHQGPIRSIGRRT